MSNPIGIRRGVYKSQFARRMAQWMNMMAHPPLAIEISAERIAGARWSRANSIEDVVVEELPAGSIVPSTTEPNLVNFQVVYTP